MKKIVGQLKITAQDYEKNSRTAQDYEKKLDISR